MRMDYDDAAQRVESAVVELERAGNNEGAIITGWVVVAEFIDREGNPYLGCYAANGLPYWRVNGLLDAAPHVIGYLEEYEDE